MEGEAEEEAQGEKEGEAEEEAEGEKEQDWEEGQEAKKDLLHVVEPVVESLIQLIVQSVIIYVVLGPKQGKNICLLTVLSEPLPPFRCPNPHRHFFPPLGNKSG